MIRTCRKLSRVLLHVPKEFLEEFDRETRGLYASRNEAIRAGMIMLLETIKRKPTTKSEDSHIINIKQNRGKRNPESSI